MKHAMVIEPSPSAGGKHWTEPLRSVCSGSLAAAFAIALARRTGWLLVAVRDRKDGRLVHVGAETPDGRYADARGFVAAEEFLQGPGTAVSWTDEEALSAEAPEIGESEIARAASFVGMVFGSGAADEARDGACVENPRADAEEPRMRHVRHAALEQVPAARRSGS